MNANATRLYPEQHNNDGNAKSVWKYKVSCQEKINKESPDTRDWLELVARINHDSPQFSLFTALLDKKNVVVKVGPAVVQKEFSIGQDLEKLGLPTFLPYSCLFTCLDDTATLKRGPIPPHLCRVAGEKVNIIVMPELKGKSIDKYTWAPSSFPILQNILKHIVMSLCVASATLGFVHRDLHLYNVMLVPSKRKEISYGIYGTLPVMKYIPIIFDYDMAETESNNPREVYTKDIQRYVLDVDKECNIKFRTDDFKQLIADLSWEKVQATPSVCATLCKAIDSLTLIGRY